MFLKRKIPASSLTEVIIAISIIALCIGIASLVFIRSTRVTINFQDVKRQTEIQSKLWKSLFLQESEIEDVEDIKQEEMDSTNDSLVVIEFIGADDKIIWKQDWIKGE